MCSIQSQPDPAVPASARSLSAFERSRPQVWQCPRDDDHTTNVGVEILTIWGWIGDGLLLCRSVYIKSRDECFFAISIIPLEGLEMVPECQTMF